jgi:hypothetical protein
MKTVLFGNIYTDYWKLSLDDISVKEDVIALNGELNVGFFRAMTPMCISSGILERFAADLQRLNEKLEGSAVLESKNISSEVCLTLTCNHVGHIKASGSYSIKGNTLNFSFQTDQTQLAPLLRMVNSSLSKFRNALD